MAALLLSNQRKAIGIPAGELPSVPSITLSSLPASAATERSMSDIRVHG